jgi:predicted lipoprotein with Yx(FWY)xxD motif
MQIEHRPGAASAAAGRPRLVPVLAAALAAFASLVVALAHPAVGGAAQAKPTTVSTVSTSLGRVIVDARGRTLYLFKKDASGRSACTGSCAASWPPLLASGKPVAGGGVKASLLGTTKRSDGRMQVTYDRHPLYTFVEDTKKGQTAGQNVDAFGAEWYVVSPAGSAITKTAARPSTTGASGGYGG